ncbi:MAG: hypothetical protein KAG91_02515, partial [Mycoplasmataceae bacterium]|nr:hypothetical protein [Mycoplasmataceae bacterium]
MQKIKKISIYDFNPRYFKDNTGTGTGDFRGLASKFEYFSYLGVDAVILQDVLSSNSDSKFQSFTDVSPELGDMNGLQLVISHARKHKIKLFIELKIGGIKQSHNWYTLAKQESDLKFGTLVDFNKSKEETPFGAKYDKDVKAYVSVDQSTQEVPLNWNSERTIEKFLEVVRFWKGLGINGFVFKDFEYISDKTRTNSMSEATLTDLRKFYRAIKEVDSKIMVIGKSGIVPLEHISEYTTGRTKVFDYLQTTRLSTNGTGHKFGNDEIGKFKPRKLFSEIASIAKDPSTIVSLGSEDTGRIVSRWGDDGQYRNESAKSLAILSFLTPASNTIYYADELGAKNIGLTHLDDFQDKTLKQRKNDALERKLSNEKFMDAQVLQNPINGRSLMMWNSKKNGGFSVAEKTITPASTGYVENNVEVQHNDDTSILNFYKKLNKIIHS